MNNKITNIGNWPRIQAQRQPKSTALIQGGRKITYDQFNKRIQSWAHAFSNQYNLKFGDRVAVVMKSRIEFLEILFAASSLGAITVPFNHRLAPTELDYLVRDASPSVLAYEDGFEDRIASMEKTTEVSDVVQISTVKDEGEVVGETDPDSINIVENVTDHPAVIPYTGGTTGRPKGAVLTHGNLLYHTLSMIKWVDLTKQDTTLTALPLFHTGGLNIFSLPTIYQGGTLVMMPDFEPSQLLRKIEQEGVNVMFGVPTIYRNVIDADEFEQTDFSSVRVLTSGGDYCPPDIVDRFGDAGIDFTHGYGLTESGPGVLTNYASDEDYIKKMKEGSVGKPYYYSDVKIVDENGNTVPTGETGELLTKGPHVMDRYWNNLEATAEGFTDGWLHTGDIARRDEDEYYYIEGRMKDMIVSGGENIYLPEIERALISHENIEEAAVIGIPDEKWGQIGKAVIQLSRDAGVAKSEITSYLEDRLASYKVPKEIVFVDSIPVGPAGSVKKETVREQYGET